MENLQAHRRAYIEAYAASDDSDGPSFALVLVTAELLARLKQLSALCVEHNLSELRVYESPELWGPGDVESDLRLTCGELVVTKDAFWFVDQPKHAFGHIETRSQTIDNFCSEVEAAENGTDLYFGENTLLLIARVGKVYEVTAAGFDASSDETDHLVFWIASPSFEILQQVIAGTSAKYCGEVDGWDGDDIDYYLPSQSAQLCADLNPLASPHSATKTK